MSHAPKRIAIIASGRMEERNLLQLTSSFEAVIAVDGGVRYLIPQNIAPLAIVGDFDSASPADLAHFPEALHEIHFQDKDKSDTELAVEYAFRQGADSVVLFAAMGDRVDHGLANLFLLTKYPGKLSIETESQTLYAIHDSKKEASWPGRVVSFFPLGGKVEKVVTKGLKWNLENATLNTGFYSLSNRALGSTFEVSIGSGSLICILENG